MRPIHWILEGTQPVPLPDDDMASLRAWGAMMQRPERIVAQEFVTSDVFVSTVFLGVDHSFSPEGPPILFETKVEVGGQWCDWAWRYPTWEAAQQGHAEVVRRVQAGTLDGVESTILGVDMEAIPEAEESREAWNAKVDALREEWKRRECPD